MINYMKSEIYRLCRKKDLHLTSVIALSLIIIAAVVLHFSKVYDQTFPYATNHFFYSNVIAGTIFILIIGFLFNLALTGRDMSIIKQVVSFGVSRQVIYWSKLILTLSYFLLICGVGLALMIGIGENFLTNESQSVSQFLIASFNMLPLILSAFFVIHAMKMMKVGDLYVILMLLFIYTFSGDLLRLVLKPLSGLSELHQYAPSTQLNDNLMNFVDQTIQFDFRYWITALVISVVFLVIGAKRFSKQNID